MQTIHEEFVITRRAGGHWEDFESVSESDASARYQQVAVEQGADQVRLEHRTTSVLAGPVE